MRTGQVKAVEGQRITLYIYKNWSIEARVFEDEQRRKKKKIERGRVVQAVMDNPTHVKAEQHYRDEHFRVSHFIGHKEYNIMEK